MKRLLFVLLNLFVVVVFTWPALALGYVFAAIQTGVEAGMFIFYKHVESADNLFSEKGKK